MAAQTRESHGACHVPIGIFWRKMLKAAPLDATNASKHLTNQKRIEFYKLTNQKMLCRATITNQVLIDREGTFILLSASHSTRVSIPTTAISGPILYIDERNWIFACLQLAGIETKNQSRRDN